MRQRIARLLLKTPLSKANYLENKMLASILVADDYNDNRELLRLILESSDYTVVEARNGRECVDVAREMRPDIALIDLSMPVLDGWNALKEIRADERTRRMPCVAVTAFAAEEDRARALNTGFDAYIAKPYRAKDILNIIVDLLAARGTEHTALTKAIADPTEEVAI